MNEEVTIIDKKTRNEKIKDFFVKNKKVIIYFFVFLVVFVLSFYFYQIYKDDQRKQISEKYNSAVIDYENNDKIKTILSMRDIIEYKDSTYSPLALYFIIDNKLVENKNEVNEMFDILINKTSFENEIKNLIIYKKALYNADDIDENDLLNILRPLVNSESVWKSHALYLLAEYFYSKKEKQKSKEFFNQIINLQNANQDIAKEAQKRLNRDLSE
tara:strand:+ start:78 stop:722 length:645 start_codon:yes stop_codon:yes gene_type:complete